MRSHLTPLCARWPSSLAWTLGGAVLAACGFSASHAPLGGDYRAVEAPQPKRRDARADALPTAADDAGSSQQAPDKKSPAAAAPLSADASPSADNTDLVRYEPFTTGQQIRADVAISFSSEFRENSGDVRSSKMRFDAKLHVDLKILKSSAQTLDELEVTLTPISLHTDFDGQGSNTDRDPAETYDVTLSGQTPNIRAHGGSPVGKEDRIVLMVLLTPLAEFHKRWAHSPTLVLKPGWSSQVPLTPPAFMSAPGESIHVGPLAVRYAGRDTNPTSVPFELGLPVAWSSDFGSLSFDGSGRVMLGAKGRPVSLDLSGPISGNIGPTGAQVSLRGSAKFGATLSYP
jgi:hypothetical protein